MISTGGTFTAFFDANVLFSPLVTDLILELAVANIYRPKWSQKIHDEWISAVLRARPNADESALRRRCAMMDAAFPDAMISIIAPLTWPELPDPNDAHVVAAALVARADVIVTNNTRDFPEPLMATLGMVVQSADEFLRHALAVSRSTSLEAIETLLHRRKKPAPWNTSMLALELESRSLLRTAKMVRELTSS